MADNINPAQLLKSVRQRKYLARDFSSLRSNLVEYAKTYYNIEDLSEHGVAGLLLDFAAIVGDNNSFYLDHQFSELDPDEAVETTNIERHLKNAGVPIMGAAPALVYETVYVIIPASGGEPSNAALPIVQEGSTFLSRAGVVFNLLEDIDYTKRGDDGELLASVEIYSTDANGNPKYFVLSRRGLCMSGNEVTETFTIGSSFVPFRRITLTNPNVQEITLVSDNIGNVYHEVSSLADDVVFERRENDSTDKDDVTDVLKLIPAPYRFTKTASLSDRITTLTFGGGSADSLEDDVIPDPSDFALPIRHRSTFPRSALNPEKMLTTRTLGVAAVNTTLSISYRYGGGLDHNAPVNSIRTVRSLNMIFPNNPTVAVAGRVRDTVEVNNLEKAEGGEDALTVDELTALIPSFKNSQERIASKPDLLARVYTIPSNYGRVFRANIVNNPNNPDAAQLHIVSRDSRGRLTTSPDTLKQNLKVYLTPYRMISDAIDILDTRIINLQLKFSIVVDPKLNKNTVLRNVITELRKFFDQKNSNIDQAINISNARDVVWRVDGVRSIDMFEFETITGTYGDRTYFDNAFEIEENTLKGYIFPPRGGIFEIRYPDFDLIGKAV